MNNETPQHPVLAASKLSFSYPDKPEVLRGIDLTVEAGERVGLIGPNGAGKTTLFQVIGGILKPTGGGISLLGEAVKNNHFNPRVAMVFQNPDDQLFCPSVQEDVAFGPRNMALSEEEVEARVSKALAVVGGKALAKRPVHHLSQGESRIVSIAGVLAMRPELIMYDEPSANLDIRSRRRLIHLMAASKETIIVASHDLELILEVCSRVVLMDKGRIIADGRPRDIMGDAALMEAHGQEKPHSLKPHQAPHNYN